MNKRRRQIGAFLEEFGTLLRKHHRNSGLSTLEMAGFAASLLANVLAKQHGPDAAQGFLNELAALAGEIAEIDDAEALRAWLIDAKPQGRA